MWLRDFELEIDDTITQKSMRSIFISIPTLREPQSWNMNECVFIYRTYQIVSQGGLQFYLSEIGRQLVKAPLAAAISPYLISLTHPAHA